MTGLIAGCFSFLLFLFYDLNQVTGNKKVFRPLFAFGTLLLAASTVYIIFFGSRAGIRFSTWALAFMGIMAVFNFVLLIYTLFFALPFEETYVEGSKQKIYTKGVYALCRHPGVLWLFGFYLFLGLFLKNRTMIMGSLLFSACNIIYVIMQDKYFFPHLFEGYDEYKREVPFLIPSIKSTINCFDFFRSVK